MKLFTIKCHKCKDRNPLDNDDRSSIKAYFYRGMPNTFDRMVIYCENCGNKEEYRINWQIDLNEPANSFEQNDVADAQQPRVSNMHGVAGGCVDSKTGRFYPVERS